MSEAEELAELQAGIDALAVGLEAIVWQSAGHAHPTDFAEWQQAFEKARQHPEDEELCTDSTRLLDRLLFG